jgi:hypothetical protein
VRVSDGRLTHELIKAYELPQHLRMCHCGTSWQPASAADINRFHTDMYVAFLQELTCNAASVAADVLNHVLNQSVCFAENAWCACCQLPPVHDCRRRTLPAAQRSMAEGEDGRRARAGSTRPCTRAARSPPRKLS